MPPPSSSASDQRLPLRLLSSQISFVYAELHVNETTLYLLFWVWLLLLSLMFLRLIQVSHVSLVHFLKILQCSVNITQFMYPLSCYLQFQAYYE